MRLNERKTLHRKDDRGEYIVQVGCVADTEKAREERNEVEAAGPPEGYHFWSSKAQRSSRGRRGQYEVWWRKTMIGANWR